jgi:sugar O-acyltransferase (sialic acid O-acetyltransferase NeuD family)
MIYLIGAGGHAKVILEILELQGEKIGGLCDKNPKVTSLFGYSVSAFLPKGFNVIEDSLIVSIGNNSLRKKISLNSNYNYFLAIHPNATISKRAEIAAGTVVMAGVSINSGVKIGSHSIINTNASIDHDCYLEDYVHISPNAALAGNVYVSEGTHIGIGACIIQGVKIGRWATIGAGSVVLKDVPDYAVVAGVPGIVMKYMKQDAE